MPPAEAQPPSPRVVLYSRENCGLCDELLAGLAPWLVERGLPFELRDVDADPLIRRRFGLKVPVVTVDGHLACHGHLDLEAVARLLDS